MNHAVIFNTVICPVVHMSLMDTDVSLRADPYPTLRGPMGHRQLIFGLDNDWDGERNLGEFPGINCGFVYCSGRPGGAAHVLIARWAARIEGLLIGQIVRNTFFQMGTK